LGKIEYESFKLGILGFGGSGCPAIASCGRWVEAGGGLWCFAGVVRG